ncbi:uncharacterized protein M421DRAFT_787 [Didymella exigua CBS 183.55]|uniref:Uncharacterized protein n=1 Tax=Didymella exigua CBS 183.55 TaxID=1150837 RepID=A0A6A5RZT8_9PLEO|nr:uncharacterized protein M421DRAFT_787 [Didymella exigua CBS 183.55]KAF1933372.1 hypothetical protein M421DRAFT_787 [Didymella exigua CBS 183.55]
MRHYIYEESVTRVEDRVFTLTSRLKGKLDAPLRTAIINAVTRANKDAVGKAIQEGLAVVFLSSITKGQWRDLRKRIKDHDKWMVWLSNKVRNHVEGLDTATKQRIDQLESKVSSQANTISVLTQGKDASHAEKTGMLKRFAKLEAIVNNQQTYKADLTTLKSELAAVTAQLSTAKKEDATNNVVVPPQAQLNSIRESMRAEILAELRQDIACDRSETRKCALDASHL